MADNFDEKKQMNENAEDENQNEVEKNGKCYYERKRYYSKYLDLGILVVIILALLSFKYELVASGNNVYRINKITGQVQQIKGTRFIGIDKILNVKLSQITQLKAWDDLTIGAKDVKVSLKTLWRDGRLYYKVTLSQSKIIDDIIKKENYYTSYGINLCLEDKNGFIIKIIPIQLSDFINVVSTDFKYISDSIELSYEDAKYIKHINVTWNFPKGY